MKHSLKLLSFLLLVLLVSSIFLRESFTSPGTLVQLSTSHVPTDSDYLYATNYYKQVRQDLRDMTGSD